MKLWVDDIRPAPEGYDWEKSVWEAKYRIKCCEGEYNNEQADPIEVIDIDHDAGAYIGDGGNYIKLLDWLEETGRNYPIHIHSMNAVGVENMRRIIERNNWKEI